ncbi:phage/plasmid primase, P4 family [Methylocella silvestris BL2]|uniref:Phage/plasmid primase, P4 family n=1 Tax=Methylocella silvestris (strain DSM 15510 / CIP 108128 / LMG 27833 / NCIMB 13906 / BL2) TaxID=395965 RepID=B8ESZ5_METSB|nr:phage/plasmid primase, P4 family [Methylocella silvestris]ACK51133.1 phage/plasmid primase, P4 family [Methylocella silvestris BL2]
MADPNDIVAAAPGAEILAFPNRASETIADDALAQKVEEDDADNSSERDRGTDADSINLHLAHFPLTDLGNAERFAARHKDNLRYCPDIGWLHWDGRRWAREGAEEVVKRAEHVTVRAIQDEAVALRESGHDAVFIDAKGKETLLSDKIAVWGRTSEAANRMASISKRADSMLSIQVGDLDADKMKISVANGTLHIAKRDDGPYVVLKRHDPADYITKISPVGYDAEAVCPRYDRFLDEVQPPDAAGGRDVQIFLNQWAGLSLTGDTSEQKITFHYGKGRNGKSVWVKTISFVAGDYADSIPIESFLDSGRARAGGQATPDLAGLPGVRMLTTSEPKKGATLDEGLIKLFSGGDVIKARHLNKGFFAFTPQAKLTMQGNYRPRITGADEGIWNRLVLVPWGVYFPADKRDPRLEEKLRGEASGVLNRLLDGLCAWLDGGLRIPSSVAAATADYRSDSDPLGRFLEACTRQAIGKRVQATDMHALFAAWAKSNGEAVWSAKGLGAAMKERGLAAKKSVNVYWLDIELTKGVTDFVDQSGHAWRGEELEREGQRFDG